MGKIADLHAGALDDAAVAVDQGIDLVGERLDLTRESAVQPFAFAGADLLHRAPDLIERPQAEENGERVDPEPSQTEDGERDRQVAGEAVDIGFEHVAVARHAKARRMALDVENDLGLGDLDLVPEGILGGVEADIAGIERHLVDAGDR